MAQKYNIFLNDQRIVLEQIGDNEVRDQTPHITCPEELWAFASVIEKDEKTADYLLVSRLPVAELAEKAFPRVKAAGGLVFRDTGELLLIFRRGLWDLPKGKANKKESLEECALREVSEETGLTGLTITGCTGITHHLFKQRQWLALKETTWYEMAYSGNETPVPEAEEDITEVRWCRIEELPVLMRKSYRSIAELLLAYMKGKPSQQETDTRIQHP